VVKAPLAVAGTVDAHGEVTVIDADGVELFTLKDEDFARELVKRYNDAEPKESHG
jgi:hypothetical protein